MLSFLDDYSFYYASSLYLKMLMHNINFMFQCHLITIVMVIGSVKSW